MVLAGLMGRYCHLCAAILAVVVCFGVPVQAQQTGIQTGIQSPIQSPVQNPYSNTDPKVETSKQTNERIKTLSMGARTHENEYRIGAGDLLSINVFDVPDPLDGWIYFICNF